MIRSANLLPLFILTCIGCSGEDPKDKVGLVLEVCAFTADFAKTDIARVDPNTTVGEALSISQTIYLPGRSIRSLSNQNLAYSS